MPSLHDNNPLDILTSLEEEVGEWLRQYRAKHKEYGLRSLEGNIESCSDFIKIIKEAKDKLK